MTPPPRDDASAYADGHPDAVRRARPPEPPEAAWEEMRLRIHARVATPAVAPSRHRGRWGAGVAVAALTATAAAVVAWLVLNQPPAPPPNAPDVARAEPVPPPVDPLAEWDVLPIAAAEEVVLRRVPGDGWLPVGAHPLDGELTLATADEVALDDPNPEWPTAVVPSPKHAPMIFATKPR